MAALILVMVLAAPFIIVVPLLWTHTSVEMAAANSERQGVTYLRPLVRLLAAATDQQSLDVAGAPGNGAALLSAIQEVDKVDTALGESLATRDRWANVRQRLTALVDSPPAASSAYQSFGQAIDLVVALIETVGDRSTLILDPDLDSYYLMDATVLRLPAILVSSGRLTDRASTTSATRAVEVAVLADQVRQQSAILDVSMRKSFKATRTSAITGGLVSALDQFGDAITSLTPPTPGFGGITGDTGRLLVDRGRVRDTGLVLQEKALTQLDALLRTRVDDFMGERRLTVAAVLMALAGLVGRLLLRRLPGRRDREGGRRDREGGRRWLRPFGLEPGMGPEQGMTPEPGMSRTGPGQEVTFGAGVPAGAGPEIRGQR